MKLLTKYVRLIFFFLRKKRVFSMYHTCFKVVKDSACVVTAKEENVSLTLGSILSLTIFMIKVSHSV